MVRMATGDEKKSVARTAIDGGVAAARGAGKATTWVGRNVGAAREVSGAGNPGLMRLVDVHALSAAGDALILIGLLSALFTSVPVTQARTRVALLLVAVLPFAVLSPL